MEEILEKLPVEIRFLKLKFIKIQGSKDKTIDEKWMYNPIAINKITTSITLIVCEMYSAMMNFSMYSPCGGL